MGGSDSDQVGGESRDGGDGGELIVQTTTLSWLDKELSIFRKGNNNDDDSDKEKNSYTWNGLVNVKVGVAKRKDVEDAGKKGGTAEKKEGGEPKKKKKKKKKS